MSDDASQKSERSDPFWAYVQDAVNHLDQRSYYQLLGVDSQADGDSIGVAYYALVRRLHPDRHVREPTARRQALTRLFARVGEAYRVLSKANERRAYDRILAHGDMRLTREALAAEKTRSRTPDPRTPKARALYDRGQQLLTKGDSRGARAQWQLAIQFEPQSKVLRAALARLANQDDDEVPAADTAPTDTTNHSGLIDVASERKPTITRTASSLSIPIVSAPERTIPELSSSTPSHTSPEPQPAPRQSKDELLEQCEKLALALEQAPHKRKLRASWYATLAHLADLEGQKRVAALHRQTALAFDARCEAAKQG